jgi:5-methylcytosine-specific restriction endonuclease McrA
MAIDYSWCRFSKPKDKKVKDINVVKIEKPKVKKPIKKKDNKKRTKAVDISKKVKESVYKRDKGLCILCGKAGIPNAHYIKRSQGGLGIEQNVVCLCVKCHYEQDMGKDTELYTSKLKEYLKGKYENWNEKDLIYRKGV